MPDATRDLFIAGLDLGGTSVKSIALSPDGIELARATETFNLEEPMAFALAVEKALERLESQVGSRAGKVGLSAPGIAARDGRSIAYMPGRFPGLTGLDWTTRLARGFVPVLNDAHAALLGEVWQGAARGAENVILITLGTGVGGAAMVDGRLLRGHSGKAGHLGHVSLDPEGPPDITGAPGSLEDAIGNHSIRARTGGRFETTHALVRAHEEGDPEATRVWLQSVRALAAAIASFTNVLDPEVVIIGGGIGRSGAALFDPLRRWVSEFEWKVCGHEVRVVPAALGELAGAYGAARNAALQSESPTRA
jgi:glucokinase